MNIDRQAVANVMNIYVPEFPTQPEFDKAERFLRDLERAIERAVEAVKYSDCDEIQDYVESIGSEMDWFVDVFWRVLEYASSADDCLCGYSNSLDDALNAVYHRLDPDEMDEYKVEAVKRQLEGER